jgi:hypothetical protein
MKKLRRIELWWSNYYKFGRKFYKFNCGKKLYYYRLGKLGLFIRGK